MFRIQSYVTLAVLIRSHGDVDEGVHLTVMPNSLDFDGEFY